MTDERVEPMRIAVVGGGISGLSAAWFLRQGLGAQAQIVVYDKQPDAGGHLRVSEVAGVPVDEGAESLLARRPEAVDLAKAVGMSGDLVDPAAIGAGLWSRGELRPMPAGTVMGVPEHPSQLSDVLDTTEIDEASADTSEPGMPIDDDVAIGRLVRSRYGPGVVDRLVEPMLGGVYAGNADELSLDATVPALGEQARRHASLGAAVTAVRAATPTSSGPVFAGLRGGIGRLPAAVAASSEAVVRTGVTVRELHRLSHGWRLVTGPVPNPVADDVDAVVVATPPAATARLLTAACPTAAHVLREVETASMAIVTLALPRSAFPRPLATSGFLVPPVDGRLVKAVTYSSAKWPWLGDLAGDLVLLRASVGRHRQVADLQRDDQDLVAGVLADVRAATGLAGSPVDARVTRWGGALPQYAVGHVDRVRQVREAVTGTPRLAVCGAVYDGVGVPACIASAQAAATRVVDELHQAHARIET